MGASGSLNPIFQSLTSFLLSPRLGDQSEAIGVTVNVDSKQAASHMSIQLPP